MSLRRGAAECWGRAEEACGRNEEDLPKGGPIE